MEVCPPAHSIRLALYCMRKNLPSQSRYQAAGEGEVIIAIKMTGEPNILHHHRRLMEWKQCCRKDGATVVIPPS